MALKQIEKEKIIKEFAQSPNDTGSTEVQIAILTKDIRELTGHCKEHPHDFSSNRGLLKMVCQRKKLLKYLERQGVQKYKIIIEKLGLRK